MTTGGLLPHRRHCHPAGRSYDDGIQGPEATPFRSDRSVRRDVPGGVHAVGAPGRGLDVEPGALAGPRRGRTGQAARTGARCGCGRGRHVPELVRRGWEVVGIDYAPRAIDEARARCIDGATFVVGDVTDLPIDQLGTFSFFFDIGCFQHLDGGQRSTAGRGITALATPAATLLMMAFSQPTPVGSFVKGISPDDVQVAFPGWDLLTVADADTTGMDWPMRTMQPMWMRLRHQS